MWTASGGATASISETRMETDIVIGEILAPTAIRPVQFYEVWSKTRARTAEQRLALEVLKQAVLDLQKYRYARRSKRQRLYMEAYSWVASSDLSWPYSFVNICEMLNLSPEHLREELLSDTGSAALRQAA